MNPFKKFNMWFNLAKKNHPFDHTAFALGTENKGEPHVRMVLLKLILEDGFVFFSNLNSNKGSHFKRNKNLSMCFYWESIHKQIRIVGKGSIVKDEISDKYFGSRPRGSQIGAWTSDQSSVIKSFGYLKQREKKFEKKFEGFNVPRPAYWVGIKIEPKQFEFWQQGDFRLHRREVYYLKKNVWQRKLLSP